LLAADHRHRSLFCRCVCDPAQPAPRLAASQLRVGRRLDYPLHHKLDTI